MSLGNCINWIVYSERGEVRTDERGVAMPAAYLLLSQRTCPLFIDPVPDKEETARQTNVLNWRTDLTLYIVANTLRFNLDQLEGRMEIGNRHRLFIQISAKLFHSDHRGRQRILYSVYFYSKTTINRCRQFVFYFRTICFCLSLFSVSKKINVQSGKSVLNTHRPKIYVATKF